MPLWVVFDLDNTLILNTPITATPNTSIGEDEELVLSLYQDTERTLKFLSDRGIPIALASFRTNAEDVVKQYELRKYFAAIVHTTDRRTDKRSKSEMIHQLATKVNLSPYDALFFDDLPENVEECNNRLINTVYVDPDQGVTFELLFDSLLTALRPPFYVLSNRPLPNDELVSYLGEYRVVFLTCGANSATALDVIKYQPTATVMYVPAASTIDLFHQGIRVRVVHEDLWECLDAAVAQLQEEKADIPNTIGELIRQ